MYLLLALLSNINKSCADFMLQPSAQSQKEEKPQQVEPRTSSTDPETQGQDAESSTSKSGPDAAQVKSGVEETQRVSEINHTTGPSPKPAGPSPILVAQDASEEPGLHSPVLVAPSTSLPSTGSSSPELSTPMSKNCFNTG